MDHPYRWVFYKLSQNTSFQRNHSYVPSLNLTILRWEEHISVSNCVCQNTPLEKVQLQTSLQPLVLVGDTGSSDSKRGKPRVKRQPSQTMLLF